MSDRPLDKEYWVRPWSSILFTGDLFEAIPFGTQTTELYTFEDKDGEPLQHFQGEVAFAYGLLISPTCDMYEEISPRPIMAHKFRVLVPVLTLEGVVAATQTVARSVGLIRNRDQLSAYMYLPELREFFPESVACLYRPALVSDDFLANPPRRIAQMHPEARRQLKIKLATYWGRARPARDEVKLVEDGEEKVTSTSKPPSRYDAGYELNL